MLHYWLFFLSFLKTDVVHGILWTFSIFSFLSSYCLANRMFHFNEKYISALR